MTVRIVTDSTCDLPGDVVADYGLTVVPLVVSLGDEEFVDGPDLDLDDFYARLRAFTGAPRTSQPSVERFIEAYDGLANDGDGVVSIHISSRMSGTLNSASVARERLAGRVHIDLVDSYNVSLGLGAVVLEAAEAARAGADFAAVGEAARRAVERVRVVALVETLEYLRRGGRIGRARSMLGSLLNIKPILHIERGEMAPFERVRTWNRAVDRLAEVATADRTISRLFVAAAGDDDAARALLERVAPELPHTDVRFGRIGPIVGVHGGPGLLGICPVARR
jgi:DegV family protein with EDD domain